MLLLTHFSNEEGGAQKSYVITQSHTTSFLCGAVVKNLPANAGDAGSVPGLGRYLEKEMAAHSSIPA